MSVELITSRLPAHKAAADLSAKQFYLVEITAADTVNVCNGATDVPVGVLQNKPVSGEACEIAHRPGDICKVKLGGTVTVGAWVGTHTDGTAVAKTTDKDFAIGRALEAGDAGAIVAVLISPCYLGV